MFICCWTVKKNCRLLKEIKFHILWRQACHYEKSQKVRIRIQLLLRCCRTKFDSGQNRRRLGTKHLMGSNELWLKLMSIRNRFATTLSFTDERFGRQRHTVTVWKVFWNAALSTSCRRSHKFQVFFSAHDGRRQVRQRHGGRREPYSDSERHIITISIEKNWTFSILLQISILFFFAILNATMKFQI